jgi:hypothetical protein
VRAARTPVIADHAGAGTPELSGHCFTGWSSLDGVDEFKNGDGKFLRAGFQVFSGFVHKDRSCRSCSARLS